VTHLYYSPYWKTKGASQSIDILWLIDSIEHRKVFRSRWSESVDHSSFSSVNNLFHASHQLPL